MGKFDKSKSKTKNRHNPLDQDIIADKFPKLSTRVKVVREQQQDDEFVDDKLSKKILEQAKQQQEDIEEETGLGSICKKLESSHVFEGLPLVKDDYDNEFPSLGQAFDEPIEISKEDEEAFNKFMPHDAEKRATLADIIKGKLTDKKTELQEIFSDVGSLKGDGLEKVEALYKGVGKVLSMYRSGKLPKAFKAIPKFTHWEQILYITEPDKWSAAAMYQATRIFTSNLKADMAQRFYNLILLPRLRDDIAECKRLNVHLYMALKKALFKPGALFKGIILPLCESGTCTLREATIFGSVLSSCSIPILHSSAALLMIAQMGYSGASSIFMRVLIEKKYSLPFAVIDGVVEHFLRFMQEDAELPLLWHQCLLTFVQIYKNDLSLDQKRAIIKLLRKHPHKHVSPEIRRELQSGINRGNETAELMALDDGED